MKYIVTKSTQKEDAAVVEAEDEAEALETFINSYNFEETKNLEISKITVVPLVKDTPTVEVVTQDVPSA